MTPKLQKEKGKHQLLQVRQVSNSCQFPVSAKLQSALPLYINLVDLKHEQKGTIEEIVFSSRYKSVRLQVHPPFSLASLAEVEKWAAIPLQKTPKGDL